jgi:hypothetical protein
VEEMADVIGKGVETPTVEEGHESHESHESVE